MLAAGYVVRLGRAEPIRHYESPRRNQRRMDFYGRRNDVLFAWHNVPAPDFFGHFAATVFNGLRLALTRATHPWWMVQGTLAGITGCLRLSGERRPVPRAVYRLSRRLKKGGPAPLAEIKRLLPPSSLPEGVSAGLGDRR